MFRYMIYFVVSIWRQKVNVYIDRVHACTFVVVNETCFDDLHCFDDDDDDVFANLFWYWWMVSRVCWWCLVMTGWLLLRPLEEKKSLVIAAQMPCCCCCFCRLKFYYDFAGHAWLQDSIMGDSPGWARIQLRRSSYDDPTVIYRLWWLFFICLQLFLFISGLFGHGHVGLKYRFYSSFLPGDIILKFLFIILHWPCCFSIQAGSIIVNFCCGNMIDGVDDCDNSGKYYCDIVDSVNSCWFILDVVIWIRWFYRQIFLVILSWIVNTVGSLLLFCWLLFVTSWFCCCWIFCNLIYM